MLAGEDPTLLVRPAVARGDPLPSYDEQGLFDSRWDLTSTDRIRRVVLDDEHSSGILADDLELIIGQLAGVLEADGWALTCAPKQGAPGCLGADTLGETFRTILLRAVNQIGAALHQHPQAPIWCERLAPPHNAAVLVIPIQDRPGDDATFVNLIFARVDDKRRKIIEATCLREWPRVAAYLRLWQRARRQQLLAEGARAALDLVAIGIVLLSADGQIVFANDAAKVLMANEDGIREYHGQLQATRRGDAAAFAAAVGHVLGQCNPEDASEPLSLLMLRRDHGPPLVTSFIAAPRRGATCNEDGALLFFVDPGLDIHHLAAPVCKLFRLSRVETELACLLASGHTLSAAAQSLHIKVSTARGYLKQVFVKTGSNRQADLVRLIFSNLIRTVTPSHSRRR